MGDRAAKLSSKLAKIEINKKLKARNGSAVQQKGYESPGAGVAEYMNIKLKNWN